MVSAVTADPLVFFQSEPDSGSSVDNLVPGVPGALQVAYAATRNLVSCTAPADPDIAGETFARFVGLLGRETMPRRNPVLDDDCVFRVCD